MAKFKTHIYKAGVGGHLRITLVPAKPIFKDGQRVGDEPGKYADFVGGVFETDNPEVIAKLKSLPSFGTDFFEASEEPASKPAESSEPSLDRLTKQELLDLAKSRNIEVDEKLTKAEITDRLKVK